MGEVLIGRDTAGTTVAEVDLDEATLTVAQIVDAARVHGAGLVWAHGGSPEAAGFVPRPGYARLHADDPVAGDPLPPVAPEAYGELLAKAYVGMWGHKWVDPTQRLPTDGSVVLCLEEDGVAVGLCRVWPRDRLVDQPGVVPERRGSEATLRLLGAACSLLGPGPVDVDTWGEDPETLAACASLGFSVTEQQSGWELRL
jgi:hypothetical protein